MLRVAVIGGGPSGSCAAEILAKAGIKTWIFERKLDNAKPCGGAIPPILIDEFDIQGLRSVRPGSPPDTRSRCCSPHRPEGSGRDGRLQRR